MFDKLTVIDCSTVLAGPSVGSFFAELGARVIKIENPKNKDVTRSWKLQSEDPNSNISAYFAACNFKKEYQFLDFTDATDKKTLLQFIDEADILLTNFKKGDDSKFGLSDEILFKRNPKLIHGKISGFGQESDRVAYDLILQAETGFMSMNGTPESGPVKMPVALIDVLAAHQLKEGILVALLNLQKNQKAQTVSVSLYDAAICSLANQASNYLMTGKIAERIGSLHPNIAPYGELFQTADNAIITFAIGSNRHFSGLCTFLNLTDLITDIRFSENTQRVMNRTILAELLQAKIKTFDSKSIALAMHQLFIPMGIVNDLKNVFEAKEANTLVRTETLEKQPTKRITQIAFQRNEYGN